MATKKAPPPKQQPRSIYIVDDHPLFREGLAGIIRQRPDLRICGQADTAAKAFEEIRKLRPDILVTDIGLPGKSGMELLKDMHAYRAEMPVLVISMHDETLYAERVLKAGGRGYIMKQEGPDKIIEAINTVLGGRVYLSEKMAADILLARRCTKHCVCITHYRPCPDLLPMDGSGSCQRVESFAGKSQEKYRGVEGGGDVGHCLTPLKLPA